MTGESAAPLKVKFQFRMTEEERRMLEEMTERNWPGSERTQSLMLRRIIREAYAKGLKQ